jgi:hypothetical protein
MSPCYSGLRAGCNSSRVLVDRFRVLAAAVKPAVARSIQSRVVSTGRRWGEWLSASTAEAVDATIDVALCLGTRPFGDKFNFSLHKSGRKSKAPEGRNRARTTDTICTRPSRSPLAVAYARRRCSRLRAGRARGLVLSFCSASAAAATPVESVECFSCLHAFPKLPQIKVVRDSASAVLEDGQRSDAAPG